MRAIWIRTRSDLQRRAAGTLALALLFGLAAGVATAAFAGARQTAAAFDQFVDESKHAEISVYPAPPGLEKLPMVADVGRTEYWFLRFEGSALGSQIVPFAAGDDHMYRTVNRGHLEAGRRPNPSVFNEIAISPALAARQDLRPGDTLRAQNMTFADIQTAMTGGAIATHGDQVELTVTGVLRQPTDLVQSIDERNQNVVYLGGHDTVYLTPSFFERYVRPVFGDETGAYVRLKHGKRDLTQFVVAAKRLAGPDAHLEVDRGEEELQPARRALRAQALALNVFGALAALATVLVFGQALARHVIEDSSEYPTLRAIGMSRRELVTTGLLRASAVALAGAAIAVGVAVLLSPVFPVGFARQADVHPGFSFDAPILGFAFLGCIVTLMVRAALPAIAASRLGADATGVAELAGRQTPSRLANLLAKAGGSPSLVAGVRMALEPGRGRSAVPVRTALAGAIVAVGAIAASLAVASSIAHVAHTPRIYGWTWDVAVGNPNNEVGGPGAEVLAQQPYVGSFSGVATFAVDVNGLDTNAVGMDTSHGSILPPATPGRMPTSPDEIAVQRPVLDRLHKHVGDAVQITGPKGSLSARIVGEVVAEIGGGVFPSGIVMPMPALKRIAPQAAVNVFFVRFAPNADKAAAIGRLKKLFGDTVLLPLRSADLENLSRISWMPGVLATLLLVLGLATVGHMLIASVRRRRRELAVLKSIGFRRRQIAATVAWQATTTAIASLLIGLPAGIATGRWIWRISAQRLGIVPEPTTPLAAVAFVAVGMVVFANILAVVPAVFAARTQPALALRTE
ncbi:MAG: FtsX-like permease family protein [Actinomycetota bacterium]|nr:ABC transporter permease [Actinomycetota bacterium]